MYKDIFKKIKDYNNIIIVRHIGADPDALSSQIALRDSIRLTFPEKKVYALGATSVKFNYFPKLDKYEDIKEPLLIVVDTPDKKRVDFNFDVKYVDSVKIDHHPFIETFCKLEYIKDNVSSTAELIIELIRNTKLKMNDEIASMLFLGVSSDTNRFLFNSSTDKTFENISYLLKNHDLNIQELYKNLYMRPLNEIRLQGYIAQNMKTTENGLGYIIITNEILNKFNVDSGSAGNLVNSFNYVEELCTWVIVTEDIKNKIYKVNARSRGPVINSVLEKYNGGGHKYASGARVQTLEESKSIIEDLDRACEIYFNERVNENEN